MAHDVLQLEHTFQIYEGSSFITFDLSSNGYINKKFDSSLTRQTLFNILNIS